MLRKLSSLAAVTALLVLALSLTPAQAGGGRPLSFFCKPEFCTAVYQRATGRIDFRIQAYAFRGYYRLCVTDPRGLRVCRRARLRAGCNCSVRDWKRNFPDRRSGRYRVEWRRAGKRLGPVMWFRKPT